MNLSKIVDTFIINYIKKDSVYFNAFGGYQLHFYKETSKLNEHFVNKVDGMFSYDYIDMYDKDLLFVYKWSNEKFKQCDFYDNGKVIQTFYDRGFQLLKRDSFDQIIPPGNIIIEDVPESEYERN